jgi:hypothetical protein
MALLRSVTAAPLSRRPLSTVALSPAVTAADLASTEPLNALLAPSVVAPTGTQNTSEAEAPPVRATIELAVVSSVLALRKMYRPGPLMVKVPVMVIAPA